MTLLPCDLRRYPADAERLVSHRFPHGAYLGETGTAALATELARLGIAGGSVYDALVCAVARHNDQPLLTRD
jgi:hypothetical protein